MYFLIRFLRNTIILIFAIFFFVLNIKIDYLLAKAISVIVQNYDNLFRKLCPKTQPWTLECSALLRPHAQDWSNGTGYGIYPLITMRNRVCLKLWNLISSHYLFKWCLIPHDPLRFFLFGVSCILKMLSYYLLTVHSFFHSEISIAVFEFWLSSMDSLFRERLDHWS